MRRMLVVDDERDICDCLQHFFTSRGFAVEWVFSGEEAIARLRDTSPDVVVLDVLLPGVSGLEVLKHLKARRPTIPVVIITGSQEPELRTQAIHHGAADFITKPFDFSDATWSAVLNGR